jgi:hypothetical protein
MESPKVRKLEIDFISTTKLADISNSHQIIKKKNKQTGLKKVTADMKTKNRDPNEKVSVVPASSGPKASSAPKAQSKAPSRPPKFGLEGNKWTVVCSHFPFPFSFFPSSSLIFSQTSFFFFFL